MQPHRIRNVIPPIFGLVTLGGFVISATVGVIVLVVAGALSAILWTLLSRGGTPSERNRDRGRDRSSRRASRRA